MKAWVLLSKHGDIVSCLPILYSEFKATGNKQNLIISSAYLGAIDGVSYIEPFIYPGLSSDLAGAIKWAKKQFDEVVAIQAHGTNFPIQHRTPGFHIDQYLRAGHVSDWDKLPLVFDQRDRRKEYALTSKVVGRKKEPFILFGDKSVSAPFEFADELFKILTDTFGSTHKIIRLSEVKADRLCDLIGLYDKASALVTVDTVHVHLSKASKVPAFVLARDGWAGASCSRSFRFYCRYGEWNRRKLKMISELQDCINGQKPIRVHQIKTEFKHGYNLSAGDDGIGVYRYHDRNDWRTSLAIALKSGETHKLTADPSLKEFSIEDARRFTLNGKSFASYVVGSVENNLFTSYVAYGEIKEAGGAWSIGHVQPKYGGNDFSKMQKNWVPFVIDDKLYFIYGNDNEKQTVLEVQGDKVVSEHTSPAPKWGNGVIRGGCVVAREGYLLRVFHSRTDYSKTDFRYFVGAALMENKPPFATTAVGKASILYGDESYTPDCKHWKKNVTFPLGATIQSDKIMLSLGINDCQCALLELTDKQLRL
jgi:hypothetical protein